MLREQQKQEALERMKKIGFMNQVIEDFDKNNTLFYSEKLSQKFNAVLYGISYLPKLQKKIKQFEKEYNALVYHVQLTHTEIGDMYSFLYVSKNIDEWEYDRIDLKHNELFVYVWNGDIEEFGSIGYEESMGGINRIW